MKKRWIVLLLTVALVLGLAVFAMAAGEEAKPVIGPNGEMYHCVCGNQHYAGEGAEAAVVVSYGECYGDCDGANHTWLPWTRKGGAYNNGEWYYYLDKNILPNDVTAVSPFYKTVVIGVTNDSAPALSAPSSFHLDLNGYSYIGDYRLFRVDGTADYSASLTISDSSKENMGELITTTSDYGAVFWLRSSYATANIYSGTLESKGTTTGNGGAINSAGNLNIYGSVIKGGNAANGGAIYNTGTLAMNNSTIKGSIAAKGGAIYNTGTLKLNGGTVFGNGSSSTIGGAIYTTTGTVTINDGATIYASPTSSWGGAIYIASGTVTMNNGRILARYTDENGAQVVAKAQYGVAIRLDGGTFNMNDGLIVGGEATASGGGAISSGGTINMKGGTICDGYSSSTNASTAHGGGNINTNGTFTMSGGIITGGKVASGRGGAINARANITVSGNARIIGNTDGNGNACNVYLQSGKVITIGEVGLTEDASIGVTMADTSGQFASDNAPYGVFVSDKSGYEPLVLATGVSLVTNGSIEGNYGCICGADNRTNGVHTQGCYMVLDSDWTEVSDLAGLTAAVTSANSGEEVYVRLMDSVQLTGTLTLSAGKLTIDLNGKDITTSSQALMFNPKGTSELTITDRSESADGTIVQTGTSSSWGGGLMRLEGTAKMYIFGGEYDASGLSVGYGGVIRVNTADNNLYMHGGVMRGGTTTGSGGSAISCAGKFYMTGGTIYGGTHTGAATFGGGAIATNKGKLYISGNAQIIGGKTTTGLGGAIFMRDALLEISGNALIDGTNSSAKTNGGVIYAENSAATSQIVMKGGEIKGGTAASGGTIYLANGSITMDGGTITGGTSTGAGGAVFMNQGILTINGGTIRGGAAATNGGTIFQNAGTLTMTDGTIIGGTAGLGGGAICAISGTTTISGGAILGGTANSAENNRGGGAIYVAGGNVTVSGAAVIGNGTCEGTTYTSNATYGAAVHINSGTLNINGGIIHGGTGTEGGAVFVFGGTLTINNGTIYGGSVARGGAIFVNSGRTVTMHGGTIYAGNATDNGGAISVFSTDAKFIINGGTIDAAGKTVGHGVAIGNNAGEVVINGGLIIGGTTTGSGGAAISSFSTGNKFTMNGGTITGGIHNGSNAVGRGGAVRVSGGTLVMTGGTITGGTNKVGVGGGLMVTGTSSATISGNVVITGNTDKNGNASNLYLDGTNKITFGEGGLGKNANIGITMTTPGVFTTANASDYATKFISDNGSYYVVYNADTCVALVAVDGYEGVVAIVGSTPFDTAQGAVDAVTDSDNQYVKLMAAVNGGLTINKNLYLDLNGNTITGNISNEGYTLYAFDSATDDYLAYGKVENEEIIDDTYGKIIGTISGKYSADFVTPAELFGHRYRYVAVNEGNNTYSFHRIHLSVKSVILYPTTTAIDYKVSLRCDEVVAKHITEFGIKAYATAYQTAEPDSAVAVSPAQYGDVMANGSVIKPYGAEGNENIFKVRIAKILNDGMDAATQELRAERFFFTACAYIKLNGNELTSVSHTNSLEEVVKQTEALASAGSITLNTNQKWALSQMYTTYQNLMEPWFAEINGTKIPGMVEVTKDYEVHCLCGDETSTNNPCANAGHPDIAWEPWDGTSNITAAGNYYLTGSTEKYQLWLGQVSGTNGYTINIDLNGNNFTAEETFRAFGIGANTTVNLTNSKAEGGVITGKFVDDASIGGAIYMQAKAALSLYPNVTVKTDGASVQRGGTIYVTNGWLNLFGGTVVGSDLSGVGNSYGGAILLDGTKDAPSSMLMRSGNVYGGSVAEGGGAIQIGAYSTVTMTGGQISGRYTYDGKAVVSTAKYGAAIRLDGTNSYFNLRGGTVVGGDATGSGGGAISNGGHITMTAGTITGGRATTTDVGNAAVGGGNINNRGTFTMTGGIITDGESANGRGSVYVRADSTFTVSGTARITESPKNVCLEPGAYINIGDAGLSGSALIGVTMPNEFGQGTFTTKANATAANAAHFRSDAGYNITASDNGLNVTDTSGYSVGYGAASIDPDLNDGNSYGLVGYSNEADRIAATIEEGNGLLATCLAVTDAKGDTVLMISIDSAYISPSHTDTVRSKISAVTGVPVGNIMISAAHQHSSPLLETNYLNKYFYPGIVSAAEAAMTDRATVTGVNTSTVATTSNGAPQFGFVRNITLYKDGEPQGTWSVNHDDRVYRYGKIENGVYKNYESYMATFDYYYGSNVSYTICNPDNIPSSGYAMCYETVIDSNLQLVKFERATGDIIMANFQVHPHLASTNATTVITADVVGAFRNALASSTGADVMYFSGASGDINPTSYIGDTVYEKTADEGENIGTAHTQYGTALAALAQNASYSAVGTGDVSAVSKTVTCSANTNQDLDDANRDAIIARAAEITEGGLSAYTADDKTNYGIYSYYHAKYITERAALEEGATRSLTLGAYSIGDIAFVAAPYEMFCTNGEAIKAGSGFKMTIVATQANGDNGYIPSEAGYTNGGYSTDITRFAAGTGEQLVSEYLTLLSNLKTAN